LGDAGLSNPDIDARRVYADAGSVNHRRPIAIALAVTVAITIAGAVDERRRGVIAAVIAAPVTAAAAIPTAATPAATVAAATSMATTTVTFGMGRYRDRAQREQRAGGDSGRKTRRQSAFRFGVNEIGYDDLLL
jgi:hypothetical protein